MRRVRDNKIYDDETDILKVGAQDALPAQESAVVRERRQSLLLPTQDIAVPSGTR